MSANKKLAAIAAGFVILLAPMAGATAETRTHHRHVVKKAHYRPDRPVRVASGNTWRYRTAKGWDNSCHNIPYLNDMYACSAR
jgi:hypothetical protein